MRLQHYPLLLIAAATAISICLGAPWWLTVLLAFIILNIFAAGAIFIRLNFFIKALHHGKSKKHVALTFDDGPATHTDAILDTLWDAGVKAAFFTIGARAAANPETVRRWENEGHIIGNHSYNHGFFFDLLPAYKMRSELERTNEVVENLTGRKPLLFRPPYGVTNPALARAVAHTGMTAIGWSLRTFDTKAKSKDALIKKIFSRLKGGDIILLHDSIQVTADALTDIIKAAREKGFTFVRLDELLHIQPYA